MNKKDHDIRSTSPVEELVGNPPSVVVRWGITIIAIVFFGSLAGSWILRYPDVISAKIVITTTNPPASIMAHVAGSIENMFVEEGQYVAKDELLALLETSADLESVLWLSNLTGNESLVDDYPGSESRDLFIHGADDLGELNAPYSDYKESLTNFYNHISIDYYGKKIEALLSEISGIDSYLKQLSRKEQLYIEKLSLAEKEFKRDSMLYSQQVTAEQEYENSKESYFNSQIELEQVRLDRSSRIIERSSKIQILEDYKAAKEEERSKLQSVMENKRLILKGEIEAWYMKHLLISPINGIVTFSRFWGENQVVNEGDVVMTVIPEGDYRLFGRVDLPMRGSGKVEPGQLVIIKLAGYPFLEYGNIEGRVASKSLYASGDLYSVTVDLPEGLVTNRDRVLQFNQNMSGTAEIVTGKMRLLERLIYPFRYIIEKNRMLEDS